MVEIIKVILSLEIEVEDVDDKNYYLKPLTGTVAASCIADVWDNADNMVGTLKSVNGLQKQDVQKLLNTELGI